MLLWRALSGFGPSNKNHYSNMKSELFFFSIMIFSQFYDIEEIVQRIPKNTTFERIKLLKNYDITSSLKHKMDFTEKKI